MSASSKSWADDEGFDAEAKMEIGADPIVISSKVENGIKTVVERFINEYGEKVQTTRKFKIVVTTAKVSKNIAARRKWAKFGDCAGKGAGPEKNITQPDQAQTLILSQGKKTTDKQEESGGMFAKVGSMMVCRNCGEKGTHWTLKCPKRKEVVVVDKYSESEEKTPFSGGPPVKKYVPKFMQEQQNAEGASSSLARRDENTIRVSSLSEDANEDDLRELMKKVGGSITKYWLATDRKTRRSKGFAYVTYTNREDAERAIQMLDGHPYDSLILRVEFAKPKAERPAGAEGDAPPRRQW
jgi:translation initiation factor 3 subunit G